MKHALIPVIAICISMNASAGFLGKLLETTVEPKDLSKVSTTEFIQKFDLTQNEYTNWIASVLGDLRDETTLTDDVKEGNGVAYDGVRVKQPSGEQIISIQEKGKVFLTDKAVYEIIRSSDRVSSDRA